ncbi:1-aminocyclopropane-1-carboxylate synthase 11 [Diplonema papillatum]|nr:1-aminocyclopropane-1-carboxylate synthase 11 [Diplonema papillatum]
MTLSQQGRDTLAFPNREFMKVYQDGIKRRGVVNMCLAENHVSRHLVHKKLASIRVDESSLSYADYCGDSDLRAAAAQFLTTFLKGRVATDDITAFNGVGSALLQLSLAVCDPGDTVAVPGPFYYGFLRDLTAFSKARIQCLPPAHQLTPPLLQGVYDDCMLAGHPLKLVVLCNPDNPTGTVTSPESVRSIASWCAQRGVHLMIDEIYALSVYRRKPFAFRSVLELFSDYGLPPFVHQVWGLSKDFCSSGLRCAFLVSRNAEVNAAVRKFAYFFQIGHPIQQQCAALLLDTAWVRGYVKQMQQDLLDACCMVESFLDGAGAPYVKPQAGFFVWCNLSSWTRKAGGEIRFLRELASDDVAPVLLCSGLACESPEEGWFRVCFTACSTADLKKGLARVGGLLKDLDSGSRQSRL